MYLRLMLALAITAASSAAHAQGVPRVAVSLELGAGSHTMQSGETYFREGGRELAMAAATVRVAQLGRFSPVVRLETVMPSNLALTSDCPFAPNGTCRQHFPQFSGWGLQGGVFGSATRWLSLGALAGFQQEEGVRRRVVEGRALMSPFRYVAATAAIRRMSWQHPTHGRLWYQPVIFGVQLQLP